MSTSSSHNGKVIITCAITGSIHTPSMSPYLPVTPNDIVDAGVEAAEAGAAILHLHARDPESGRPDQRPEAFAPFLARIKQATNAVVNLTSGGSPFMTIEERIKPSIRFKPELASLNTGSMNFGLFPMLNRFKDFKHEWERQYLESTRDLVFRNTFKDIEFALTALSANGTRFEFECYDVGHPYDLAHFAERKLIATLPSAECVRHPRRHRYACGGRDAHAAHGGPSLRRRLPLVSAGGSTHANADRRHGRLDGRPCARRPGRRLVDR
jgi:uncharacterized protein (DUF849 family)